MFSLSLFSMTTFLMKSAIKAAENINLLKQKKNLTLEEIVMAVINNSDDQIDRKNKYWTALIWKLNLSLTNQIVRYIK